jgi:DNA-binding NtrC family response regulator
MAERYGAEMTAPDWHKRLVCSQCGAGGSIWSSAGYMPGIDGLTLLGEIGRRFPDLPVIMVIAYGAGERRRRADELGAAEFITKPVDFDRLKEQLRQLPAAADYKR